MKNIQVFAALLVAFSLSACAGGGGVSARGSASGGVNAVGTGATVGIDSDTSVRGTGLRSSTSGSVRAGY